MNVNDCNVFYFPVDFNYANNNKFQMLTNTFMGLVGLDLKFDGFG